MKTAKKYNGAVTSAKCNNSKVNVVGFVYFDILKWKYELVFEM